MAVYYLFYAISREREREREREHRERSEKKVRKKRVYFTCIIWIMNKR